MLTCASTGEEVIYANMLYDFSSEVATASKLRHKYLRKSQQIGNCLGTGIKWMRKSYLFMGLSNVCRN